MLLDGIGGSADPQAAAVLYDRACTADHADSCVHLAWMGRHDGGREPLAWLQRACELDQGACVVLGEVHERKMVDGAEQAAAIEAYQRGCAADHADACFHLASVHARGLGTPENDEVAARLYQVACDGGESDGCVALSSAFAAGEGVAADPVWAEHYRARACELGLQSSCSAAGAKKLGKAGNPTTPPAR
jgi:TPR repeat protein